MSNKIFVHYRLPYFCRVNFTKIYEYSFTEIKDFIVFLRSQGYKNKIIFVLNHMWEKTNHFDLIFLYKFFKKKFKEYKINFFLLYSTSEGNEKLPDTVIQYNFFQNKTVYASTANNQQTSMLWNNSKFKGLLLTGKSNKIQRLLPLQQLIDANLLNNQTLEWSFFYIEQNKSDIKTILNFSEEQFQNFISKVSRNPDSINDLKYKERFDYDGFPYDHNLYKNTSWSLISETSVNLGSHWITEKTYRAIINKHPFIFFGQPNTEKFLRENGYHTFDYCYPYQYDNIENTKDRITTAIQNIKFLRKNWNKLDFNRINTDIEHNYEILYSKTFKDQVNLIKILKFNNGDLTCDFFDYRNQGFLQNDIIDIIKRKNSIIYYNWEYDFQNNTA
jgi:hypothetical protein